MAKIKLKFGENEIEVDSRDFYVDNQTLGEVIENLANLMGENQIKPVYDNAPTSPAIEESNYDSLNSLEDIEIFEPEFNEPKPILSGRTSPFYNTSIVVTDGISVEPKGYSYIINIQTIPISSINIIPSPIKREAGAEFAVGASFPGSVAYKGTLIAIA